MTGFSFALVFLRFSFCLHWDATALEMVVYLPFLIAFALLEIAFEIFTLVYCRCGSM